MEETKQCPLCRQDNPYYASECGCGFRFHVLEEPKPPKGSMILYLCSIMTFLGTLASIGAGFYMAVYESIYGVMVCVIGGVFSFGLTKVFDEVNQMIRDSNAADQVADQTIRPAQEK